MSRYLLDTGMLTAYLRGRAGAVARVQPWIDAGEAATSIIVYGEAIEYFKSLPDYARRQMLLRALLRQIRAHDLTYAVLERYADLRRAMRPPHGPGLIGDLDTMIAATALEQQLTLVTLDSDFARVPGLSLLRLTRSDIL